MGNFQSNVTRNALREMTTISTQIANTSISRSSMTCIGQNTARLRFGTSETGEVCFFQVDGDLIVNQTADTDCQLSVESVTDATTELINLLSTKLDEEVVQKSKAVQEWLALAVSIQANEVSSEAELITEIQTAISNLSDFSCDAQFISSNNQDLVVCGLVSSSVILNQDAYVTGMASCVNKVIQRVFSSNTRLSDIARRTDQEADLEQQGVGSLLSGLQYIMYAVIAIIVLVIIGAVIYFIIRSRRAPAPTATAAAPRPVATQVARRTATATPTSTAPRATSNPTIGATRAPASNRVAPKPLPKTPALTA